MKNKKVILLSLIALVFAILAFFVDWLFLIPAIVIVFVNQRELMKKR